MPYKRRIIIDNCVICGDKASGVHFSAVTCESCKAFFRRNALRFDQYMCFLGGNCNINLLNRKSCKRCRLKKCFDIGMKIELILSEEQRRNRIKKIAENRNKRQKSASISEQSYESSVESMSMVTAIDPVTNNAVELICTYSKTGIEDNFDEEVMEIERYFTNNSQTDSIADNVYQKAVEFSVKPIAIPITEFSTNFNDMEGNKLTELFEAVKHLESQSSSKSIGVAHDFNEAINILRCKSDQVIKQIVKMAKCLSAFKSLCEPDQIVLLKYASIEILCMRLILCFNFDSNYWTITDVFNNDKSFLVQLDLLKDSKRNIYVNHKNFIENMRSIWDSDQTIIDLLTAIVLFDPNRPKLIHTESIKCEQQLYMDLLQRYLHMRYRSECEAKTKFLMLLNNLNDLHILNEKIAMNWSESEPNLRVMPLMKEISDRNEL